MTQHRKPHVCVFWGKNDRAQGLSKVFRWCDFGKITKIRGVWDAHGRGTHWGVGMGVGVAGGPSLVTVKEAQIVTLKTFCHDILGMGLQTPIPWCGVLFGVPPQKPNTIFFGTVQLLHRSPHNKNKEHQHQQQATTSNTSRHGFREKVTGKVTPLFAHTRPLQNPDATAKPLGRPRKGPKTAQNEAGGGVTSTQPASLEVVPNGRMAVSRARGPEL